MLLKQFVQLKFCYCCTGSDRSNLMSKIQTASETAVSGTLSTETWTHHSFIFPSLWFSCVSHHRQDRLVKRKCLLCAIYWNYLTRLLSSFGHQLVDASCNFKVIVHQKCIYLRKLQNMYFARDWNTGGATGSSVPLKEGQAPQKTWFEKFRGALNYCNFLCFFLRYPFIFFCMFRFLKWIIGDKFVFICTCLSSERLPANKWMLIHRHSFTWVVRTI